MVWTTCVHRPSPRNGEKIPLVSNSTILRNSTCPIFKGLMLWLEEAEMKGWRLRFLQASMSLKVIAMSSKFVISPCRHYVLFCRNQISCRAHPMIIHKFRSCQSNYAIKSLCYPKFAIYFLLWHMNYMSIRQSLMLLNFVITFVEGGRKSDLGENFSVITVGASKINKLYLRSYTQELVS